MRLPISTMVIMALDAILAGLALYGGINLLLDATGSSLGMQSALDYIPFVSDFMPFALWLVIVFAAFPAVLIYGLYTDRKWALIGTVVLVGLEVLWIGTQIVLLHPMGFSYWWIGILGIAAASLFFVLRPATVNFLWNKTVPPARPGR